MRPRVIIPGVDAPLVRNGVGDFTVVDGGHRQLELIREAPAPAARIPSVEQFSAHRPAGGFGCVYADPPWLIKMRSKAGEKKSPQAHYACMPTAEICRLPVAAIAAQNSALFMWATAPMLMDALQVMTAWGFAYNTQAVWVKLGALSASLGDRDDVAGAIDTGAATINMGTGYVFRGAHEILLVGKRGEPPYQPMGTHPRVRGVFFEPVREHSRKPALHQTLANIVGGPYVELFARERVEGWTVWGDQVDKFTK